MKKILYILGAVAVLAGCSKHDDGKSLDNLNGEIRLSTAAQAHQTRADLFSPDVQIAASQQVGLHITTADGTTPLYTNYNYTADGFGGLDLPSDVPTPYYPKDGGNVKISAYHPHASNSAAYDFVVADNQNTDADYYSSDLLFSAPKEYRRQTAAHLLTFKHVLSKATYTLVAGTGSPDLTGATVEFLDLERAVSFNPTTGAVTAAAVYVKGNITPHATYGAIVAPQTVAAGKSLLKVTLANGATLYYKAPTGGQTFAQGVKYHFTITVKYNELAMTVQTAPWEPVGNVNGDAELGESEGLPLDQAQVGDFYCMDGFGGYILPKDATLSDAQKAACVGIVLKAGKDNSGDWKDDCDYKLKDGVTPMSIVHGYVLALYDVEGVTTCKWGSTKAKVDHPDMNREENGFYGYKNTNAIKEFAEQNNMNMQTDFPAAYHAIDTYEKKYSAPTNSSGWFLASAGQCKYWLDNKDVIVTSVQNATANPSYSWNHHFYWSSSEYSTTENNAYVLAFDGNQIMHGGKEVEACHIRPILAF